MEQRVIRRMRRIRAMSRWSRMKGWHGHIPGSLVEEYASLQRLIGDGGSLA